MKTKLLLLSALLGVAQLAASQTNFVTTWQTYNANETITIPTFNGEVYNYDVDWENDGIFDSLGVSGDATHSYPTAGIHTVAIRGSFPRIYFNNISGNIFTSTTDTEKIISIEQWGSIAWTSMRGAFAGCYRLAINATDIPDLTNVIDMSYMLKDAQNFNSNIGNWDVSNINDMSYLFQGDIYFNQDIGNWNVSNVTNMEEIFAITWNFNQDISSWDVSNVTNMSSMFDTSSFNQDIGGWDVSSVTDMSYMFSENTVFNQNISGWNVSNVTNMSYMFYRAESFNQDIGGWNVSNVNNMSGMFNNTWVFNQNISGWNVSNVTNMQAMFFGSSFNQDIGGWNVSSVTDMSYMFNYASTFNQNISSWNVSNVTNMSYMFNSTTSFNQDIGGWNVSNVTNMRSMFYGLSFNQDIGGWDVSSVTNMDYMFGGNNAFNQDIGNWNVSNVQNMNAMFFNASTFNQDIGSWNVSKVNDMNYMFYGASAFNQNLGGWNLSSIVSINDLLGDVTLSTINYDALLNNLNSLNTGKMNSTKNQSNTSSVPYGVTFNVGNSTYCNGETARTNLITNHGWTITDGGLDCSSLSSHTLDLEAFELYPNPSTGIVYLKNAKANAINVFNTLGQMVYSKKLNVNQDTHEINIKHLQSGLYMAKFSNEFGNFTKRLVLE